MAEVDARSSDSQGHDFLSFDTTTACNTLVIEKCFRYSFQELFCRFLMSALPVQTLFDPSDSNLRLLLSCKLYNQFDHLPQRNNQTSQMDVILICFPGSCNMLQLDLATEVVPYPLQLEDQCGEWKGPFLEDQLECKYL